MHICIQRLRVTTTVGGGFTGLAIGLATLLSNWQLGADWQAAITSNDGSFFALNIVPILLLWLWAVLLVRRSGHARDRVPTSYRRRASGGDNWRRPK